MPNATERREYFRHALIPVVNGLKKAEHPIEAKRMSDAIATVHRLFAAEGPAAWAENVEAGDKVEAALRLAESPNWVNFTEPVKVEVQVLLTDYLTDVKET